MVDPATILARNDERLRRLAQSPEARAALRRRVHRRSRTLLRRLRRMLIVWIAIPLVAIVYGLAVGPIGIGGLMLAALAYMLTPLLLVWPRDRYASAEALKEIELAAIPAQVEDWLDRERRQFPALAAPKVDALFAQLDVLGQQLAHVPATAPIAGDARRLMTEHLPRLVDTYKRVPPAYRGDGQPAAAELAAGLDLVTAELNRLSDKLAHDDLAALETESRFLQSRYGPPPALPDGR